MNRIALLLAAALIVSAPIVATVATDTVAAEKGKKAARAVTRDARAPTGQPSGGYDVNSDPNTAFIRALGDALSGRNQGAKSAPRAVSGKGAPAAASSAPAPRSSAPAGRSGGAEAAAE